MSGPLLGSAAQRTEHLESMWTTVPVGERIATALCSADTARAAVIRSSMEQPTIRLEKQSLIAQR